MLNESYFIPIKRFAYYFIIIGVFGVLIHLYNNQDPNYTLDFKVFVLIMTLMHIGIGIGLLIKAKSAFYAFKSYLYLIKIGFPIGTYISNKMLDYIEKNDIKQFFE